MMGRNARRVECAEAGQECEQRAAGHAGVRGISGQDTRDNDSRDPVGTSGVAIYR